jgi:hypothetical protein
MQPTRLVPRLTAWALAVFLFALSADAQEPSRLERGLRRANGLLAEMVLAKAPSLDLEARGLTAPGYGGLTVGVSKVQARDTSALRVWAYLFNPTDSAIRLAMPAEASFALVDARGRRLTLIGPPKFTNLDKDATEISVPALERVEFALVVAAFPSDIIEVMLKVGTSVIRGVPVRVDAAVAPPTVPLGAPPAVSPPAGTPPTHTSPISIPSAGSPRNEIDSSLSISL